MKKILILMAIGFFFISCGNEKKAEEKKLEVAVQKIDSLANEVKKSTEDLEKTVQEVKDAINELDNI